MIPFGSFKSRVQLSKRGKVAFPSQMTPNILHDSAHLSEMAPLERMDDCGTIQEVVVPLPRFKFELDQLTRDTTLHFFVSLFNLRSDSNKGMLTVLSGLSQ